MDTILSASFLTALFASGVRQSIPLIYGSVGDAVSERAGVMGISLEGEMLFGAFFSYLVALRTGSLWIGVLAGAAAGMLSSLIVAVWSVWLRQDQSIIGIMFNILAVGFTNFLNRMIFGTSTASSYWARTTGSFSLAKVTLFFTGMFPVCSYRLSAAVTVRYPARASAAAGCFV